MSTLLGEPGFDAARLALAAACDDLDRHTFATPDRSAACTMAELREQCRRVAWRLDRWVTEARRTLAMRPGLGRRRSLVRWRERLAGWASLGGTLVRASAHCTDAAVLARTAGIVVERVRLGLDDRAV